MILNNLYKKFRYYFWHNKVMDKLLTKISNAQENLDTLEKHFDYDNIPF